MPGQETPEKDWAPEALASDHAAEPPAGLPERTTSPASPTATQKPVVRHVTAFRGFEPSTLVTVQAAAPPVGLVEVATLPASSTATHRLLNEQDTAFREEPPKDGWW